jgi:hypothetical protein
MSAFMTNRAANLSEPGGITIKKAMTMIRPASILSRSQMAANYRSSASWKPRRIRTKLIAREIIKTMSDDVGTRARKSWK